MAYHPRLSRDQLKEKERIFRHNATFIVRAVRKQLGLTQREISAEIGVPQTAWSRFENGIQCPDAFEWQQICKFAHVPLNSLFLGYIDKLSLNEPKHVVTGMREGGFRIPHRYAQARGSSARALRPLLRYHTQALGPEKTEAFLESKNVDPDFFIRLDNRIGLQFGYDLWDDLLSQGTLEGGGMEKLVEPVARPSIHGALGKLYRKSDSQRSLLKTLIENKHRYDVDFSYRVEQSGKDLDVIVEPQAHLRDLKVPKKMGDTLHAFRKAYLKRFSELRGDAPAQLIEQGSQYGENGRGVYRLRVS